MWYWIRLITHAVLEAIRRELDARRFLRNLQKYPQVDTKWRDAVGKATLDEWKEKMEALGKQRFVTQPSPFTALRQRNCKNRKFKKRWPHGKHSG